MQRFAGAQDAQVPRVGDNCGMPNRGPAAAVARVTAEFMLDIRRAATGRGHRRALRVLSGIDASGLERWILHAIPGRSFVLVSQVASDHGIDLPVASRACARLEERGHLVRLRDPRDGRRTLIGLTDQTADALARWNDLWPGPYVEAASGWPEGDRETLRDWIRLVLDTWTSGRSPAASNSDSLHHDPSTASFMRVMRDLVTTAGRSDALADALATRGSRLSPSLFQALRTIAATDGGLSVLELAAITDVDRSLAGRRIRALVAAGTIAPADSGRRYVAGAVGHSTVEDVVGLCATMLPDVPIRLIDANLERLLIQYTESIRHASAAQEASSTED